MDSPPRFTDTAADTADPPEDAPTCKVAPGSLELGSIPIDCETYGEIHVANEADRNLTIGAIELSAASAELSLVDWTDRAGPLPWHLLPGAHASFWVRYAPKNASSDSGTITLHTSDRAQPTYRVQVNGQGEPHDTVTDTWEPRPLDIVLVVDTSPDMRDHVDELLANIPVLDGALRESLVDFRYTAVIQDNGCVLGETPYLNPDTPREDVLALFREMFAEEGTRDEAEQTFTLLQRMLEQSVAEGCNTDWLRPDSEVHAIGLSSTADQSPLDHTEYLAEISADLGDPSRLVVHGIGGPPPHGCPGVDFYGGVYPASQVTGGSFESLCRSLSSNLEHLGETLQAAGLPRFVSLSRVPDPATIQVSVNAEPISEGWSWDATRNAVVFDSSFVPSPLVEVSVHYETLPPCAE